MRHEFINFRNMILSNEAINAIKDVKSLNSSVVWMNQSCDSTPSSVVCVVVS